MNAAWMLAQERLIRAAVAYDAKWRNAVLTSLQTGTQPIDPTEDDGRCAAGRHSSVRAGWLDVISAPGSLLSGHREFARGSVRCDRPAERACFACDHSSETGERQRCFSITPMSEPHARPKSLIDCPNRKIYVAAHKPRSTAGSCGKRPARRHSSVNPTLA